MSVQTTAEATANTDRQFASAGHVTQFQDAPSGVMADHSPAILTLQRYQQMANNSPQAQVLQHRAVSLMEGSAWFNGMAHTGQRAPSSHPKSGIGDGVGTAQRALAVAMHTAAGAGIATIIGNIDIVGRPEHQSFPRHGGTTEGDHATAWGVIRFGVVNRLRNRTLQQAVTTLDEMVTEARALPGALAARLDTLSAARRGIVDRAALACAAAATQANAAIAAADVSQLISVLQSYINAYLTYRNSIGLTVLNRGASAGGDGEPVPLALLQHWETRWTADNAPDAAEQARLVNAMGALFSRKVVTDGGSDQTLLPGQLPAETQAQVQTAMATQHRASLTSAYPNISARMPLAAPVPGQAWAGGAAPPGPAAVSSATQVILGVDGTITAITSEGRSAHGMGSSQGSHTTSHGLFERSLRRLIGQTCTQAVATLITIADAFRAMPGAQADRATEMSPARRGLFAAANGAMNAAQAAANATPNPSTVQAFATAALDYRNTMGLSTAHAGNVPGNRSEQTHLGQLDIFERHLAAPLATPIDRNALVSAIGGLFDNATLRGFNVHDNAHTERDRPAETPGRLREESLEDAFKALAKQHILTLSAAYPRVFAVINAALLDEIAAKMLGHYIAIPLGAVDYLGAAPQFNRVTPAAPPAAPQVAAAAAAVAPLTRRRAREIRNLPGEPKRAKTPANTNE